MATGGVAAAWEGAPALRRLVDEADVVWVTDFGTDTLVAFDPDTEEFRIFAWPTPGAQVRQLLGRPGEVWGAGSATDTIIVLRTG